MALPTITQVLTGEYSLDGSCHVNVTAKTGIDILQSSLDGSMWWGLSDLSTGEIKVARKSWSGIKKIAGIVAANIKKIGGTTP